MTDKDLSKERESSLSKDKLSKKEKEKVRKWLNERIKNNSCDVCKENDWYIDDFLIAGLIETRTKGPSFGTYYPFAMVSCNNCGYVRHFLSNIVGLEARSEEEEEPSNE